MRHSWLALCSLALAVAITACGSPNASPKAPSPTSYFPLTITRVGGIAGFHDVLIVNGDGLVSVTRKGKPGWRCQLTAVAAKRVATAASAVPWPRLTGGSASASFPDDLVTVVQSPAGGPVSLEDPQTGAAGRVFNELIAVLAGGGQSRSGTCTPI